MARASRAAQAPTRPDEVPAKKPISSRQKRATSAAAVESPPLQPKKPPAKRRPRNARSASLGKPKSIPGWTRAVGWMAPAEDEKMKWSIRLLGALLLVVALLSGEISWTGDGIKIGLHRPQIPHRRTQ